jgi:hypothetical protein
MDLISRCLSRHLIFERFALIAATRQVDEKLPVKNTLLPVLQNFFFLFFDALEEASVFVKRQTF